MSQSLDGLCNFSTFSLKQTGQYARGNARTAPYPNPASHMSHKRSQHQQQQPLPPSQQPPTYPGPPPSGGMGGQSMGPASYNGGTCTPVSVV